MQYPLPFADLSATQQAWAVRNDSNGLPASYEGVTSLAVCGWLGAAWGPLLPQNFDNIINAAGTLFEMSTREGWVGIMHAGVDATGG